VCRCLWPVPYLLVGEREKAGRSGMIRELYQEPGSPLHGTLIYFTKPGLDEARNGGRGNISGTMRVMNARQCPEQPVASSW